eukprot:2627160-Alexandrium_andersonii.AAC.1
MLFAPSPSDWWLVPTCHGAGGQLDGTAPRTPPDGKAARARLPPDGGSRRCSSPPPRHTGGSCPPVTGRGAPFGQ